MKHLKWIIPLLILSMVIVPAPTQAEELQASVEVLEGGVEVMQVGSKEWKTLRSDALVSTGDRVRTDEEGIALITWFEDGTFIEMQPDSEMVIEEFSGDDETFIMDATLIRGSLFNSVHRLLDANTRYQINTPSQTATVRGTVFAVNVNDDMDTAVIVVEGTVHSEHPADEEFFVPVEADNMIIVSEDGLTEDSEAISIEDAPEEYADLIEGLTAFYDQRNIDFDIDPDEEDAANHENNGVGNGEGGGKEGNRSSDSGINPGQGGGNTGGGGSTGGGGNGGGGNGGGGNGGGGGGGNGK